MSKVAGEYTRLKGSAPNAHTMLRQRGAYDTPGSSSLWDTRWTDRGKIAGVLSLTAMTMVWGGDGKVGYEDAHELVDLLFLRMR